METWNCSECTFSNHAYLLSCELCETAKPKSHSIQNKKHNPLLSEKEEENNENNSDKPDSFWICDQCTYANNDITNKHQCHLCGSLNPNFFDGNKNSTKYEYFECALHVIIACAQNDESIINILQSLQVITSRISDKNPKYRVLDTSTQGVQSRLLGFEGSLEYLKLLGYSLDSSSGKLQCFKHPPQKILNKVIILINSHLNNLKADKIDEKSDVLNPENDNDSEHDVDDEKIVFASGDFTLSQLVGLVTIHTEDLITGNEVKVLLLCHRCFSDSLELIEALRKRFFVPPANDVESWSDEQISKWCQEIQRPIQNKCVIILCEWINHYFYIDFCLQTKVFHDLKLLCSQILECKKDDDDWYDSLYLLLQSSIENQQQKLSQIYNNFDDQKDENIIDFNDFDHLLNIHYGFVKNINNKPKVKIKKKKFIYKYSAKKIAEQITLKDYEYFSNIHSRELLDKVWKGNKNKNKNKEIMFPNVQKMIERWNKLNAYIKFSLMLPSELSFRVKMLAHFIDIASYLLDLRNLSGLMAVFSALDSIDVLKLKYVWLRLNNKHKTIFNKIKNVCSVQNNFKSLREITQKCLKLKYSSIPFMGVILRDITGVNEGSAKLVHGFINFKKFERFHQSIEEIESLQRISYNKINKNKQLSDFIENDMNIIYKLNKETRKSLIENAKKSDEAKATNSEKQKLNKLKQRKMSR